MNFQYVDIHSHLDDSKYDSDRVEVLARMQKDEVGTISVGVNAETSRNAIKIAEENTNVNENIWACIGVHPDEVEKNPFIEEEFTELAISKKVVAIGECGLDYFRIARSEARPKQEAPFEAQIAFAAAHNLPLMLHVRPSKGSVDAYQDAIAILKNAQQQFPNLRGDVHCFIGNDTIARGFLDIGFHLSFTGIITFAQDYDDIVRLVPANMIHAETDAPYLAPQSYRGKRNEPVYVQEVVKKMAELRNQDEHELKVQLVQNAKNLFKI